MSVGFQREVPLLPAGHELREAFDGVCASDRKGDGAVNRERVKERSPLIDRKDVSSKSRFEQQFFTHEPKY